MEPQADKVDHPSQLSHKGVLLFDIVGITICCLIVISIAVSRGIAVYENQPSRGGMRSKIDEDVVRLQSQVELYRAQTGSYPSALSDMLTAIPASVDVNGDNSVDDKDLYGPWLKEVPLKPDGSKYFYDPSTGECKETFTPIPVKDPYWDALLQRLTTFF